MNWDDEVDVVCTGSGAAGLASAISAVDLGGEVFVANPPDDFALAASRTIVRPRLRTWLGVDLADMETNEYFTAVSSDLGPLRPSTWDVDIPVRAVREPVPVPPRRPVAPFIGARLGEWAARCLASPYGFLYTRICDWQTTTMHTADGEAIEVSEIGSMTPDPDNVSASVLDWLTSQASERDIDVHPNSALQRIVFEEGEVVGAEFWTPDGPLAIRARHGVIVANSDAQVAGAATHQLPIGDAAVRVCIVGQSVSRFGRVELLTREPADQSGPSTCLPGNRRLQVNLHESHAYSHPWRCGKVHGYPALG